MSIWIPDYPVFKSPIFVLYLMVEWSSHDLNTAPLFRSSPGHPLCTVEIFEYSNGWMRWDFEWCLGFKWFTKCLSFCPNPNKMGAISFGFSIPLTIAQPFQNRIIQKVWISSKYARILLFQLVFTKYVSGFRNYYGLIFVVFDVIFQNVIMCKYDKIRF